MTRVKVFASIFNQKYKVTLFGQIGSHFKAHHLWNPKRHKSISQFCKFMPFTVVGHAWLIVELLPLTAVGQHFLPFVVVYSDCLLHPRVALDVLQCGPVVLTGVEQPRNHLHQICQQQGKSHRTLSSHSLVSSSCR